MDVIHLGLGISGRHWLEIVRDHPDVTPAGCVDTDTTGREGRVPETHGEDNLQTLSMVEAVMLSDTTGKTIRIAELFTAAGVPAPAAVTAQRAQS